MEFKLLLNFVSDIFIKITFLFKGIKKLLQIYKNYVLHNNKYSLHT